MPAGWYLGTGGRLGRSGKAGRSYRTAARLFGSQPARARNPGATQRLCGDDASRCAPLEGTDIACDRRSGRLARGYGMKIMSVEVFVLKSPGLYNNPQGAEEPLG